jgi:glycosyltransferase involved in cell wall biosynthesis
MDLRRNRVDLTRIRRSGTAIDSEGLKRVIVVLPADNAESTLATTLADIPAGCVDEFVLVDDGSTDRTVELAREMGLDVILHPRNRGYGGNQKTCYRSALERDGDIIVMIHPDFQYDSRLIPRAAGFVELSVCDVAQARIHALKGA